MAKTPGIVLGLKPETPLERVVHLFDRHFSFLTPVGAEIPGRPSQGIIPIPRSSLLEGEVEIADGRLSVLRNLVRLNSWAELMGNPWYGMDLVCTHRLRVAPAGEPAAVLRYKGKDGLWSLLTHLRISRTGWGVSVHIIMLHPAWYPLWDCPPLRTFDQDHWMEMLAGLRSAVQDAGDAAKYATVALGHYIFHEPWKTTLVKEAETIPLVQIE